MNFIKICSMWCTGGSKNAAWSFLTGLRLLMQRQGLAPEGTPCYYWPGLEAMALPAGLVSCQTLCGTSKSTFPCFFLHWLSSSIAGEHKGNPVTLGAEFYQSGDGIVSCTGHDFCYFQNPTCEILSKYPGMCPLSLKWRPLLCFVHLECWRISRFIFLTLLPFFLQSRHHAVFLLVQY